MSIDFYLNIEKKYDLYNKKAAGINYWMFERFGLWNYNICAQKDNLTVGVPNAKISLGEIIRQYSIVLKNSIFKGTVPNKTYDILFLNHSRKVLINGEYRCIYTDDLADCFDNCFTIEQPNNRDHLKPSHNKNIIYSDYILSIGQIIGVLNALCKTKKFKKTYTQIYNDIDEPFSKLCDEYEVKLDKKKLAHLFAKNAISYEYEKKAYKKLIRRINPKIVIEVVHYVSQSLLINEICKEMGIKTIELQHGTMHSEHAGYKYANEIQLLQLPDVILSFSDYWLNIMRMNTNYTKVISTGYPYFEKMVNEAKSRAVLPEKKVILFLSQGTIGKQLFSLATELQKIIDKNRYQIIFKLHPAEYTTWRERYSTSEEPEFKVIDDSNTLLYDLFAISSIGVGVYSTSMYEGLGFNLETYIYNIAHADTMSQLVESGFARFVNDAKELYSMICEENSTKIDVEKFWKSNALNNMKKVISDELKQAGV